MILSFYSRLKKLLLFTLAFLSFLPVLSSCGKKSTDYFSYVSENRNNIFLCQTETYLLKIYSSDKETPYLCDGVKRTVSPRTEIYLTAESGDENYEISFIVDGKTYGGDMSYDNVRSEYFYFVTLDVSDLSQIPVKLTNGQGTTEMNAVSVKEDGLLSPREIVDKVRIAEPETFKLLTQKNVFQGEIYVRLISENGLYYFVGIVDKQGNMLSLLCDGKTGKVLAKRG